MRRRLDILPRNMLLGEHLKKNINLGSPHIIVLKKRIFIYLSINKIYFYLLYFYLINDFIK